MADERVCFAGDLTSSNIDHEISVEVPASGNQPASVLSGVLLKVSHERSFVTKKPVTYVLLNEAPDATGYVLDEHWKVTVR